LKSAEEWKQVLSTLEAVKAQGFDLSTVCFPKQLPFVADTARFSTAVCTRRAGKTVGVAAKLFSVARAKPGCVALYITKSRINAKRLFWKILKTMNEAYGLNGVVSEGELCVRLPNGSEIYLSGCVHEAEIENFRGMPIGIVVLDEAQSFPKFIQALVDEVLAPALMEYNGQLVLTGTPGPVPIGYFYECATSQEWSHHSWSYVDNPHIRLKSGREPHELLADELKRRGVTVEDPSIQREWFARWVLDLNALVFRYDEAKNHRDIPPCAHHVLCIDVGYDDADAIGVLGWNDDDPTLYLVEELITAKQTITPLMNQVMAFYSRFNPMAVVCDFGGLGKKIAEEIQERTGIPVEAAEKERKLEHIELLNDALRTERFVADKESRFAQDCMKVEWDRSNPEKPKISERFHSDICDAVLYGWRRCQQWLYVPPAAPRPKLGTEAYVAQVALEEKQREEEMLQQQFAANQQQQREEREFAEWN